MCVHRKSSSLSPAVDAQRKISVSKKTKIQQKFTLHLSSRLRGEEGKGDAAENEMPA